MDKFIAIITSQRVISSVCLIAFTVVVMAIVGHLYKRYSTNKGLSDIKTTAVVHSITNGVRYGILVIAVVALLEVNGVNVSSLIAGVGVAGAMVGLAMQDLLKDILMGFHIAGDRSFSIGDTIKYNVDQEGIVVGFTMLSTKIRGLDRDETVTICNRNINEVIKVHGRYDIDLPFKFDEDPDKLDEVLTKVSEEIKALKDVKKSMYLGLQRYDEYAMIYKIRVFCKPKDKWTVWRAAMKKVQHGINEAGIVIPYRTVAVLSESEGKANA